jgi:hypothetical protein
VVKKETHHEELGATQYKETYHGGHGVTQKKTTL